MRVGLIGTGMVAATHVAAIKAAGLTLSVVMGRDPARCRAFAEQHGTTATDDINIVSQNSDFVILITPPDARLDAVTALSQAGIPILSEKPLERDLPRARALVDICTKANVPLGVTLQHRMRPSAQHLAKRLTDLGRIGSVELRLPWWREQSYYDTPGRGTFARDGGGVLITQAIHAIDLMLHLCGPVTWAQAMVATTSLHHLEAEDFASAGFVFANGAAGSLMASVTHRPGGVETLVLNGDRASARLEGDLLTIDHADGHQETIGAAVATGGGADPMAFDHAWHQAVITDFAQSLRTGRAPAITGQSALAALALIDAIQASARSGQRQEVPRV